MKTTLLCIDTAGSRCAVAAYDMAAGVVLARADSDIGRGHAERLMGLIEEVLEEAKSSYAGIGKIAVVVGPGSFTGLRVGVAAAKGLALALDVPLAGVTALEALAEPHWSGDAAVLAVLDAKRGEVYAALFSAGGVPLHAPTALVPTELACFVEAAGSAELTIVGSGRHIAEEARGTAPMRLIDGDGDIASVARIGAGRVPETPLRPLYLRGADAKPQGATGVSHVTRQATLP